MASRRDAHRATAAVRDPARAQLTRPDGDGGSALTSAVSVNAVFSAVSGLVLVAGAPTMSGWFAVDGRLLTGIGAGLIGFAALLGRLLAEPRRLAPGAWWVLTADIGWVVGALVLLVAFPTVLSSGGRITLAAASVVVAAIASGQFIGLRRRGPGPVEATSPIALRVERVIAAPTGRVWEAVSDAGDYARFAPGIAATHIVAGEGEGMVRVCRDDRGGEWAETCTSWDAGHRYRMSVDVDSYPAYYRMLLAEFAQTWTVEPTVEGTRVRLEFTGRVKLGIIGRFVARLLGNRRRLEKILDGYERELTSEERANG
jgi:uncharacterized protein YndB with AHSA1/START domain